MVKDCLHCSKQFKTYDRRHKFCSKSCSAKYNNPKRTGYKDVVVKCSYCAKEFIINKCLEYHRKKRSPDGNIYCSQSCRGKNRQGVANIKTSKKLIKYYEKIETNPPKHPRGNFGYRSDLGVSFRSGWEANYARILSLLGNSWEYESKTFMFFIDGKKCFYTPDFYTKGDGVYHEVKGKWKNDLSIKKFSELSKKHPTKLIDENEYIKLAHLYQNKVTWEGRKYGC